MTDQEKIKNFRKRFQDKTVGGKEYRVESISNSDPYPFRGCVIVEDSENLYEEVSGVRWDEDGESEINPLHDLLPLEKNSDKEKHHTIGEGMITSENKLPEPKSNETLEEFKSKWEDRTRDGLEYQIYTKDHPDKNYPVVGGVFIPDIPRWFIVCWSIDGESWSHRAYNLIPLKKDRVLYRVGDVFLVSQSSHTKDEWMEKMSHTEFICFLSEIEEFIKERKRE